MQMLQRHSRRRTPLLAQQPNERFVAVEWLGALTLFLAFIVGASIAGVALRVDDGGTALEGLP